MQQLEIKRGKYEIIDASIVNWLVGYLFQHSKLLSQEVGELWTFTMFRYYP